MQNSTCPTYQKYYFKGFRSTLSGIFALWAHLGRLCPLQHTESIQVVGQIPQPNLRPRSDQPNRSDDQVPRPHRLYPKDMFHPTPNPRSRPVPLLLPRRQLLMLTPLPPPSSYVGQLPNSHGRTLTDKSYVLQGIPYYSSLLTGGDTSYFYPTALETVIEQ